jgi:ABC-2 type transport system ATP-binding protein
VTVNGIDLFKNPLEAKRKIGYLPERPPLYSDMTVYEYLDFVAEAKGIRHSVDREHQVTYAMEATGTTNVCDRLIKNLSKGFQQRVGVAQTLLGDPSVIILDEPMVGLDPKQVAELRALIRTLAQDKTVIISSHILAEISEICDHVIILTDGRVVADDTLEHLEKNVVSEKVLCLTVKGEAEAVRCALQNVEGVRRVEVAPSASSEQVIVTVFSDADVDVRDAVFFAMADNLYAVVSMEEKEQSLEHIFLSLTEQTDIQKEGSEA